MHYSRQSVIILYEAKIAERELAGIVITPHEIDNIVKEMLIDAANAHMED
jgi:hypothetical protein